MAATPPHMGCGKYFLPVKSLFVLYEKRLFVDEMAEAGSPPRDDGNATVTTDHPERRKMDRARLKGAAGTRVVYRHAGRATALRIYAVTAEKAGQAFEVGWASDRES